MNKSENRLIVQYNEKTYTNFIKKFKESVIGDRPTLGVLQIDPVTGIILNTFPSRYSAGRWICANKLQDVGNIHPDKVKVAFILCAQKLHEILETNAEAYGYVWKYVDGKLARSSRHKRLVDPINREYSKIIIYDKMGTRTDFASVRDACNFVGIFHRCRSSKLASYCAKNGLFLYATRSDGQYWKIYK